MQYLFYIIILVLAFPIGYLLAYLARDELIAGRKWFLLLEGVSLIILLVIASVNFSMKIPAMLTLLFLMIISMMAYWKSKDKKWTNKKTNEKLK
jgi:hypothetical protein